MSESTRPIPIGQRESPTLELKAADALKQPEKVAREVVAMLNAEGGEVWIGLREEEGRAKELEPIQEAERARERLWDFLIDVMDPPIREQEVSIHAVPLPDARLGEGRLLRIDVRPEEGRKPYALVRGSAWQFPVRVGARLRPMTREEIFAYSRPGGTDDLDTAEKRLFDLRDDARKGRSGLWLGAVPAPEIELDVQAPLFKSLSEDPRESGNRGTGWSFVRSQYPPRLRNQGIQWGGSASYEVLVRFFENGGATFFISFPGLAWKEEDLWPFTLLEYPISAMRILGRIYRELTTSDFRVVADLSLFDVGERTLRAGSPGALAFGMQQPHAVQEGPDVLFQSPLVFTRQNVVEEPDRCGFRLVRRVYQAFGLREEAIPREYDRDEGRLVLPE